MAPFRRLRRHSPQRGQRAVQRASASRVNGTGDRLVRVSRDHGYSEPGMTDDRRAVPAVRSLNRA
jgi:hypothetical protein